MELILLVERQSGIEIRFSRGRSADDAIVDFIDEPVSPKVGRVRIF